MSESATGVDVKDEGPAVEDVRAAVRNGLRVAPRRLPSKLFYDERGSELFEQICELPEYYLTRTEIEILRDSGAKIRAAVASRARVVEFGSGSSLKTRLLLDDLDRPAAYVPIDISKELLASTAQALQRDYPDVEILPLWADYSRSLTLPVPRSEFGPTVVFFPGSTIGNLERAEAIRLLARMRAIAGAAGGVLIGFDLQKDVRVLERAYDDAAGVTAEFNKRMLHRIRDELGGSVDVEGFDHRAVYDAVFHRIEMQLVSRRAQRIVLDGETFDFAAGEAIVTEHCHKYTRASIESMAAAAELRVVEFWTDAEQRFAVVLLRSQGSNDNTTSLATPSPDDATG